MTLAFEERYASRLKFSRAPAAKGRPLRSGSLSYAGEANAARPDLPKGCLRRPATRIMTGAVLRNRVITPTSMFADMLPTVGIFHYPLGVRPDALAQRPVVACHVEAVNSAPLSFYCWQRWCCPTC
jgi:hypothetical protein